MLLAQGKFLPDAVDDIIPQIGPWVENVGNTALARFFQDVFAQIEVFHILGLFMLGGATILTSLRLIGVGLVDLKPSEVEKNTRIWLNIGVVMAIASGMMIGLSNAQKLYNNSAFLFKMIAMIAGIVFTYGAMIPAAKADGKVGGGARIALLIAMLIWLFGIAVMVTKVGSNVGAFHVLFAGALVLFGCLQGSLRWVMVAGVAIAVIVLQIVTHFMLGDPYSEPYIAANRIFMWGTAAFLVALMLLNIFGKAAPRDSNALARLIGYSTILVWVTVGAGGRWIGLT
jgi:hypothetical protein